MKKVLAARGAPIVASAVLAALLAGGGYALASGSGMIHACAKRTNGALRLAGKCKKGERGITWNAVGKRGPAGPRGPQGLTGPTGPQGPGIVASGHSGSYNTCTLASGNNYCYQSSMAFTPSANATCQVSVDSQIAGLSTGSPTTNGPFFRIAISTAGANSDDGHHGQYFDGTDGTYSTTEARTWLIPVTAGTQYNFGAYYGFPDSNWQGKTANFNVSYVCFG